MEPPRPANVDTARQDAYVRRLERPHKNLLALYFLRALATVVAFPLVMPLLFFRYHTLRYRFDDEGVSVSWGLLFRHETYLTYRRIQDIHVNRGLLERWLGIGTVEVQTASGSAGAEMQLEGLEDYEAARDYLYRRMRGTDADEPAAAEGEAGAAGPAGAESEAVALLREVRDELKAARAALAGTGAGPAGPAGRRIGGGEG